MEPEDVTVYESDSGSKNFGSWMRNALTVVLLVGIVGTLAAVGLVIRTQEEIQAFQTDGRIRSYQTRAIACSTLIIDNDRNFQLTGDCTIPGVMAFYPARICEYFGYPKNCGSQFVASPYTDPPPATGATP